MLDEEKRFGEWIGCKEILHNTGRLPAIKEGEIWWCAMGENIGVEINGKNDVFSRPVLVFKKLSRFGFVGIPLTSQTHEGDWYIKFRFQNKNEIAVLAQVRVFSVSRLYSKMGRVDETDLARIKEGFRSLYCR